MNNGVDDADSKQERNLLSVPQEKQKKKIILILNTKCNPSEQNDSTINLLCAVIFMFPFFNEKTPLN